MLRASKTAFMPALALQRESRSPKMKAKLRAPPPCDEMRVTCSRMMSSAPPGITPDRVLRCSWIVAGSAKRP
jgi:hypothetical protein